MNEGMAECESKMSPLWAALEGLKHAVGEVEKGFGVLTERLRPVWVEDKDCPDVTSGKDPAVPCSELTGIVLVQTGRLMRLRENITWLLASLEI